MHNFEMYTPTKIVFGKNTEQRVGELVKSFGGTRVLIVYGGGSVIRSGLLNRIEDRLAEEGLVYQEFGGVHPNPLMSHAQQGAVQAAAFQADFILAVGGGSSIDEAKAIAHGAANPETTIEAIWTKKFQVKKSLPIGVVLTIAAAGSETSDASVLTNERTGVKQGINIEFNRPKFAIMNPELTYTLPKYQLACGIVDIMMHTLDRYFTSVEGNLLTDSIAEAVLRTTIENGRKAYHNQTDYDCMSEIMWCGSVSQNGLTGLGGKREFAVHKLGLGLSADYDIAHGATLSAMWGSWADYVVMANSSRFAQYARNVWGVEEADDMKAARAGIDRTVAYFRDLKMPVSIPETELPRGKGKLGVLSAEEIERLADEATQNGAIRVSTFYPLGKEDMAAIYRAANE
ncbi:iron-containing alcohol dehydrogenase [Dorea sp. OM02-2LB]|nr:iron-containing alcohol dehydrogenase [Dorea sp. OM02-2LB]